MNIDEVNQRKPRCKQCGCSSELIWVADDAARAALNARVVKNDFLGFIPAIRTMTSCSHGVAKATLAHIALPGRRCHRCKLILSEGAIVDCGHCKSLNLVWEAGGADLVAELSEIKKAE
jgi:hypothetical protein